MVLTYKSINKQCFQVEWRVLVPRVGKLVKSPSFYEDKRCWSLEFVSSSISGRNDENWEISFIREEGSVPESLLTTHIKSKNGRNVISCWEKIPDYKKFSAWNTCRDSFLQKYPDINFSKSTLTLVFTFNYGIRSYQDCQKEDKSIQTDSRPSTPSYLDDRQCLENLSLDFRKLMDDSPDPDVRLKCCDCTISAHRLILGARSEVFRTMLHSDMQEGREGTVEIVDMDPEVFQIFVQYLYTGLLPEVSLETALPLFEAGDKYRVEALKARCGHFLADNLTRETACEVLATADAHSDEDLKDQVISYILDEDIPRNDDVWLKFCDSHPKLANKVLNRFYKEY